MSKPSSTAKEILTTLVANKSITPNDSGCQDFIKSMLAELGFKFKIYNKNGVKNLWAELGPDDTSTLVFAGHTDVVSPGNYDAWRHNPFTLTEHNGKLYGRGTCDMKGAIAAMLEATSRVISNHKQKLKNKIAFLITSDEEGDAEFGTKYALEELEKENTKIDWCIVGEPTSSATVGDTVKIGRRGSLTGYLTMIGKQGHVAYPDKAYNPNVDMGQTLAKLAALKLDEGCKYFSASNLEITHMESGVTFSNNVIPETSFCQFNIRFSTKYTAESLMSLIEDIVSDNCKCDFKLEWKHSANPFICKPGHLHNVASNSIKKICGVDSIISTSGGTSDARFISKYANELIELGLKNDSAHAIDEHIHVEDLNILTGCYKEILLNLLVGKSHQ